MKKIVTVLAAALLATGCATAPPLSIDEACEKYRDASRTYLDRQEGDLDMTSSASVELQASLDKAYSDRLAEIAAGLKNVDALQSQQFDSLAQLLSTRSDTFLSFAKGNMTADEFSGEFSDLPGKVGLINEMCS